MVQTLIVPAVNAVSPSPRVSPSYKFVPTTEYIAAMQSNGWEVENQRTVKTRNSAEAPYAKHMVTMRKIGELEKNIALGGLSSRFHLINSHNGSSSVQGFLGMFRKICSNGIVIGSSLMQSFKFSHTLKAKTVADNITEQFLTRHTDAIETAERWAGITLNHQQCVSLCRTAAELRGINVDGLNASSIGYALGLPFASQDRREEVLNAPSVEQAILGMNVARRREDMGNNLWSTFNRIQENMMQGGFRLSGAKRSMRKVGAIDATVDFNRKLWDAAEKIASPLA